MTNKQEMIVTLNQDKSRILLMLRISVYVLLALVEIETLLYLWKGYQSGLVEHSPAVYLSPLVLITPWLVWRRITAVISVNSVAFEGIPNVQSALLILSSIAAISAYASAVIVMTADKYVMHCPK
jgi:hypothetical protein